MNDDFQMGRTLSTNPGQMLLSEAVNPEFENPSLCMGSELPAWALGSDLLAR